MTRRLQALRTLIDVRKRQGERLEAALGQAQQVLAARESELEAALAERAASDQGKVLALANLERLSSVAFTPEALRTLLFHVDEAHARTVQAERDAAARQEALGAQSAVVAAARAAVHRNAQRIEGFEQQLATLRRERDEALEEAAEEDSDDGVAGRPFRA